MFFRKYRKSRISRVGLVNVDKISGKETRKIVLNEKKPRLDSDTENGMIIFKPNNKEVFGYVFLNPFQK